jgi:hypothetical protein
MKVCCIANRGSALPAGLLNPEATNFKPETGFPLIVGKSYVVYAITFNEGFCWYYLCDEDFSYYPVWRPAPLFAIEDARVSNYWEFIYSPEGRCESESSVIIAYPEWARDPLYYDRLTDGVKQDVEVFKRYKSLMDKEFD